MTLSLGTLVQSFFADHLPVQKGLRLGSIRSYRDTIRLFLCFVSKQRGRKITALALDDLTFERCLAFLKHLEQERGNSVRNQRRAALNTFFAYLAVRAPEMLAVCQRVAAIPVKRTSLPDTHFLEREGGGGLVSFAASARASRATRPHTIALPLQHRR
ncbi:site-specific integrase [Mesorhizobium sp. M2A.F.Ca.ET.043.05.1.1]|uniref:site-specific integrase n=1 Tax=Mesorhizobium sp. M2A.F.Ca.ET.043.05.1.1 TaxID=2493671 RepID=UPI001FDFD000|nr:site-specific integrase [Mesorhizobium sp. M2A.F.Ca.ET.043.05.1.1]